MQIVEIVKEVAGAVANMGTGAVVTTVIKQNLPEATTTFKKVSYVVGTFMLGSFVSNKVANYAKDSVEEAATGIKNAIAAAKEKE